MGFWGIVGGAVAGVGALALAPVAGPVLAITSIGAAAAAAAGGAVAGGVVSEVLYEMDKDEITDDIKKHYEKEKELLSLELSREKADKDKKKQQALRDEAEKFTLALFACVMSVANSDGDIGEEEKNAIDAIISSNKDSLSSELIQKIREMENNPPEFGEIITYINNVDPQNREELIKVIDLAVNGIVNADGEIVEGEEIWIEAWRALKEELSI
ncbi:MAG: TerB family tellurite resistance protein [Desulforegulaceae bacterium]|nr:TerB family tellurite resistance protein [Desulforegulaceae bacterium]